MIILCKTEGTAGNHRLQDHKDLARRRGYGKLHALQDHFSAESTTEFSRVMDISP